MRKSIGIVLLLICLIVGIFDRSFDFLDNLKMFLHLRAFILVFGGTLSFLMIIYNKSFWSSFSSILTFKSHQIDTTTKQKLASFCNSGGRLALVFGILGIFLSGLVYLFSLGEMESLTPALGEFIYSALMSLIYGIILRELFFVPMEKRLLLDSSLENNKEI